MTELSPAAQAVAKAALYVSSFDPEDYPGQAQEIAAATLRAAAEIVAPLSYEDVWTDGRVLQYEKQDPVRDKLLTIADELETK